MLAVGLKQGHWARGGCTCKSGGSNEPPDLNNNNNNKNYIYKIFFY